MRVVKDQIIARGKVMEAARLSLKGEFVGLDAVIDKLVDSTWAWFTLPQMQRRPTLVNLWGMTGVGKTSLVRRYCELLSVSNRLISFDMGNAASESWSFFSKVESAADENDEPLVFVLDEFQLGRTIDQLGREVDRPSSRRVWEIIDSGKCTLIDYPYGLGAVRKAIATAKELLQHNVVVSQGRISSGLAKFYEYYNKSREKLRDLSVQAEEKLKSDPDYDLFVPYSVYVHLMDMLPRRFPTRHSLWIELEKLDGPGTIDFLEEILEVALRPKVIDCSNGLIFVIGNLDTVYRMSTDLGADIDADMFHERSLKIKLPAIKQALLKYYRPEQISRLGNNHIIYPAFSRKNYQDIIDRQLQRISHQAFDMTGIRIRFDGSVYQLVFEEGVFPAQGTRPVLSTISNLVESYLPKFLACAMVCGGLIDHIRISANSASLVAIICGDESGEKQVEQPIERTMMQLRSVKRDEMQAVVAVHESGHAVVNMALFGNIPKQLVSVTANSNARGFTVFKYSEGPLSKVRLLHRIAVLLGGYAAEALLFGKELVTHGSDHDLSEATLLATEMVQELGMSELLGSYDGTDHGCSELLHRRDAVTLEAERLLTEAMQLATQSLIAHRLLLIKMAEHLSVERSLDAGRIRELAKTYSSVKLRDVGDDSEVMYRTLLSKLVSEVNVQGSQLRRVAM